MTNFLMGVGALIVFASFSVVSGALASTRDDVGISKNAADQNGETPEMCDMHEAAVESTEKVDPFAGTEFIDPDEPEVAALKWLENEMQMPIDPSNEPQAFFPDFSCIEPPHNCPANVKCPDLARGALCIVTSCGTGACPTCPNFFGNAVIMSWCAYGCMKGKDVVGGAFGFWLRFSGWKGPVCFAG
jgi:hypothetical protein